MSITYEVHLVFRQIVLVRLRLSHRISVQELPLVLEQALLLAVPGSQRALSLSFVLVRLEGRLSHHNLLILRHPLLLPCQVLCLLDRQPLLDSQRTIPHLPFHGAPSLLEQLVAFPEDLRVVTILLAVVLLLIRPDHVRLLFVRCQLVLPVGVQVDVLPGNELDLFGGEEESGFGLAAHVHGVNV